MATQYFRVTAYHPTEDLSVIIDANGMFEKLWQLSSYMIAKGFQVLEVSSDEKFLDGNILKSEKVLGRLYLCAHIAGKHENITLEHAGSVYRAVKVADKHYIPDRDRRA